MLRNYLTVAFRNIFRNKIFSLINISGLAIGISASLVIYLIVSYELSFDKFEKDRDRIYRVVSEMHFPDRLFSISGVPTPLPGTIQKEMSGLETVAGFYIAGWNHLFVPSSATNAPTIFKDQGESIFADQNFFKLVEYKWLAGSPASLQEPFKIVLSESRAKTYFGTTDWNSIIGRTLVCDDSVNLTLSGIVKDIDEITDLDFKSFVSFSTIQNSGLKNNFSLNQWGSVQGSSQCFIRLNPGISAASIQKQIKDLKERHLKDDFLKTEHILKPLSALHFDNDYSPVVKNPVNKNFLYGLMIVAVFLLLLGCINFINLTTAQSIRKAKETGIRKTLGSSKVQLIQLYLTETFLLTTIATIISILITPILLQQFAEHIPKEIKFGMVSQLHVFVFLSTLIVVISLLSGFYPAIILTKYNPVNVLKAGSVTAGGSTRKSILRKSLTVTQFMVAQFFIIATLIVSKQIYYSLHKELGYKKDAIIIVDAPWPDKSGKYAVLLQELKAIPGIEKAIISGAPPATNGISFQTMNFENGKKKIETTAEIKYGDSAYFNLYKMKLLAGEYLKPSDSTSAYAINETFARFLGFKNPADAVGKFLDHGKGKHPIIGVLADVHTESLRAAIKPLAYAATNNNYGELHIALKNPDTDHKIWKTTIEQVQAVWKGIYPDIDFEYQFFDDSIAKFYTAEQTTATMLRWATGITMFISCLGLLGLAIYTTNQRKKEIGVRKVLGASVKQIVFLLSKDFVQLIVLAFVIATPLAWWATNNWLRDFAYRTTLDWWIFAGSGSLMIIIAMIVLSTRTIRSASANPVESLRTE